MFAKQRGVTFIGWLFLLIPLAIVGYSGIRLAPVYFNYMKVARALEQIASESRGDDAASHEELRVAVLKRFDIEEIEYPEGKDVVIKRDGNSWSIEAKYGDDAPLFSNVSLHVEFDKVVHTGSG
jgi:hypothetical protein